MKKLFFLLCILCGLSPWLQAQNNVIDEVIWVVGDDAILLSDVEQQRLYMQNDGQHIDGDPYCVIPENLAVQKLYLNQAKIDTVQVNENQIISQVDQWINYVVKQIGSKEKVEEYFNKKFSQIKEERKEMIRQQQVVQQMQNQLIGEIRLTPSEVRKYFSKLPQDSLPSIPTTVQVEIITMEPKIPIDQIDAIKKKLRDFSKDITSGKIEFASLARLYSEDPGSAPHGGELGFMSKTELLPEFANVAFNLNSTKRVSPIVHTEYGYHIIQLIEKRGDRVNCRHILLKPKVSEKELKEATIRMDSLYNDLSKKKFSFEEAAMYVSADKDTKNNKGLMVNSNYRSAHAGTSQFEMQDLPQEVGKQINTLQEGGISKPFQMITKTQKEVIAVVKLVKRTKGHKANLSDDYQALKNIVKDKKKKELLRNWILEKQRTTYVRINKEWQNCDFKYPGWVKK